MIASIDPMWNIQAYLYKNDLFNLNKNISVIGILIRQADFSQQGCLEISVNNSTILKSTSKDFGARKDFSASIQIPPKVYQEILTFPVTEYGHNLGGDGKIAFYNLKKASPVEKYFAESFCGLISRDN
jgi:hypothetical protein